MPTGQIRARLRGASRPTPAIAGSRLVAASRSDSTYSGWNTAMVFPSGSLNQAERPIAGEVTM